MKRAIPWIVAAIAVLGLAASFFELQRERGRQRRHHALFREFVIRSELAEAKAPILVIGDSITEGAKLPREIGGRAVINAGISGATVEDFERIAPGLVAGKPSFVVIALGTNGTAESLRVSYPALLHRLKALSPHMMVVGVTQQIDADAKNAAIKAAADREGIHFFAVPLPAGSTRLDGVHLNDAGYRIYTPALAAEIADRIGR
ncbi:SGNH/GDSL hydrolase family protein [Bradyrhizobium lablabi]|uniref:SGNH/GDSL hydrolase family protein n=1 Tax=Bradyrhizobium lablabi TaxID=722472 RepID=UPI001BABDCF6|nr:SGNH/GDSL hydrolase family protein [Bradyrhizobium lablabi]MBR1124902.1 SGNH/GDSL hydrolase family protein [Bradyrhizobium lablabi]